MSAEVKRFRKVLKVMAASFFAMFLTLGIVGVQKLNAQDQSSSRTTSTATGSVMIDKAHETVDNAKPLGLLAAGIAFGLGALGAGVGVSNIGAAAIGAIAEKPSMMGVSLVFVAIAEGLMVIGFVVAILIMGRM